MGCGSSIDHSVRNMETGPTPAGDPATKTLRSQEPSSVHTTWRSIDVDTLTQEGEKPWWELAQLLTPTEQPMITPDLKRRGWKTIRLFVSSTFKDMYSEREYLVKRVFPQLRAWCEERKLRLVECDLRWGIPKNADTKETLLTCLSEIERCYEENEFPYFLALLSERYGWVPTREEVPSEIIHRFKWIPGMSVTALEILTGGIWPWNPNALYMMRSSDFIKNIGDQGVLKYYQEPDSQIQTSLQKLKECVGLVPKNLGRAKKYSCETGNIENGTVELTGLEDFGDEVMDHFKQAIERQYPVEVLGIPMSPEEEQLAQHEVFMTQRSQLLLGRETLLKQVDNYIDVEKQPQLPLIMLGYAGSGKSAIMATIVRRLLDKEDYRIFYHFVGATSGSTNLFSLLRRLWKELMPDQDQAPSDPEELKRCMNVVLTNYEGKSEGKKLVIIIDALNQLDDGGEHVLTWLPMLLPERVRLIVSTLSGPCLDALRKVDKSSHKLPELVAEPLDKSIGRAMVMKILSDYNKTLDEQQMSVLLGKEDAGRPLYLSIACEELRVFGQFRKLSEKIETLAPDLTNLLIQVLDRTIEENGGDLVVNTLCLIESSRFGLLENELLDLLASYSKMGDPDSGSKLPMAEWALVYMGLRQFLRPAGGSGEGRLDFYHRTISKAVRSKYLDATNKTFWNKKLMEYFKQSHDLERRTEELPHQLIECGNTIGLVSFLEEMDTFERLYIPSNKIMLFNYWTKAGGYKIAGEKMIQAHEKRIESQEDMADAIKIKIYSRLLTFLTDIGQFAEAEVIAQKTLAIGDPNSTDLCEAYFATVGLFYIQALKVVYSSHPEYGRCCNAGKRVVDKCVSLHKMRYKPDDVYLGGVLAKCGYFNHKYLKEAWGICEKRSPQVFAEILYMTGEKNQYQEMSIPTKYFEQSLQLCLSHFGEFHLHTARCYQLFGQMYWNNDDGSRKYMNECLRLYSKEVTILTELLGAKHPITLRSREDVKIILETLGRHAEAAQYA